MGPRLKGTLWLCVVCAITALLALALPSLARRVPWRVEGALARLVPNPDAARSCRSTATPQATEALDALFRRVFPLRPGDDAVPATLEVVRGGTVNAYASLGGHIYIFQGLLDELHSPEELAGVLAHEVEHVRQRHIIQGVVDQLLAFGGTQVVLPDPDGGATRAAGLLLTLAFSRDQEHSADLGALERLRLGHVDPAGFAAFFARAATRGAVPLLLSTHPGDEARARLVAERAAYPVEPILTPAAWESLRHTCR